jgi:hypothetical protein
MWGARSRNPPIEANVKRDWHEAQPTLSGRRATTGGFEEDPVADVIPKVVVVGRPNVGKSSLFNWLVGKRIAIEDPTAGVTRDRLGQRLEVDGRIVDLVDTGGMGFDDPDGLAAKIDVPAAGGAPKGEEAMKGAGAKGDVVADAGEPKRTPPARGPPKGEGGAGAAAKEPSLPSPSLGSNRNDLHELHSKPSNEIHVPRISCGVDASDSQYAHPSLPPAVGPITQRGT